MRGLVHVHSTNSCGLDTLEEMVQKARKEGLDFIIFADHDQNIARYGIFPFQKMIQKTVKREYVFETGVENYFKQIYALDKKYRDIVVIPGLEINTHYYWSGHVVTGNLVLNNFRKHLVIIDMPDTQSFKDIPTLHNPFARKVQIRRLPVFLAALALLMASIMNLKFRWLWPRLRWPLAVVAFLVMVNQHPIESSPYHQYKDCGEAPYQDLIDYVNSKQGMVLWAHPESAHDPGKQEIYGVKLSTGKYPESLARTRGAHGFAMIYGETTKFANINEGWDRILTDYAQGRRGDYPYGYGESDYNGKNATPVDFIQTVLLAENKTSRGVLDALRAGRSMGAICWKGSMPIVDFTLSDTEGGRKYDIGQTATVKGKPQIAISLYMSDGFDEIITVKVIKNGKVIHSQTANAPFEVAWTDEDYQGEPCYYRVQAKSPEYVFRVLSNPIMCNPKQ
ncbi:PHP domain-containing protein [Planctomycetota bacterium]